MGVEFNPFEPAIDGILFSRWLRGLDEWTSAHFGLGSDDDRLRLSLAEANLERLASECGDIADTSKQRPNLDGLDTTQYPQEDGPPSAV